MYQFYEALKMNSISLLPMYRPLKPRYLFSVVTCNCQTNQLVFLLAFRTRIYVLRWQQVNKAKPRKEKLIITCNMYRVYGVKENYFISFSDRKYHFACFQNSNKIQSFKKVKGLFKYRLLCKKLIVNLR